MTQDIDWKNVALRLWRLLDDIDTQDDASKGNDAHFRKCAFQIQQKRHVILPSDQLGLEYPDVNMPCPTAIITKHAPAADAGAEGRKAFRTSEEYFADKDLFCRYVHNEVNPARLKEGLSVFNDAAINRLYDIAMNGTHRLSTNKQP